MIGSDGGGVGERAAQTQQNTRGRKDSDGKEQSLTDLLRSGKNLSTFAFSHVFQLLSILSVDEMYQYPPSASQQREK
jgi:hypothetical protein